MSMDFLMRIQDARFPLSVTTHTDINNAVVLEAAQLIKATLPKLIPGKAEYPPGEPAVILRITPLGRREIVLRNRKQPARKKRQ